MGMKVTAKRPVPSRQSAGRRTPPGAASRVAKPRRFVPTRVALAAVQVTSRELEERNRVLAGAGRGQPTSFAEITSVHQAALDSLEAQIAVLDSAGRVILTNAAWRRCARRPSCFCVAGIGVGVNYLDACGQAGPFGTEVLAGIQSVLQGSSAVFLREFACHSASEPRWFLLSVTPLYGRRGVVVSRTDITLQKQAQAASAHLAAIVRSSHDAITATDLNGKFLSWNKGAERVYGYSASEIIGQPVACLIPADRRRELKDALRRLRRSETIEAFETLRRHASGQVIPVALTLSPIRGPDGHVAGISGIARDISERRRLEAEVLRVSEREQRRIAQDLHDGLGQQVAGVACFAKSLRERLVREKSPHVAVATRILALLNDATRQARGLARGLYPVPPEPGGLMAALHDLAARTTELFHVDCTFTCPTAVLLHDGDVANHLYRIAQEATTNAVKHGRPTRIAITLDTRPGRIVLGICDNGVGIPRGKTRGNGIGLRTMHYRANLIAARLVVQRPAGGGTEILCAVHRNSYARKQKASA